MIKIFEDMFYKGKRLIMTWHFYQEWEMLNKPLEFVLHILKHGEHRLVSKRQQKFNCLFPWRGKFLCLSYVEEDAFILIHIKPRK